MGWVVNNTPRPLYSREREPVTIVQDARRAPATVWTGAESFVPSHGIHSAVRPARSESKYRLSYPSLHLQCQHICDNKYSPDQLQQLFPCAPRCNQQTKCNSCTVSPSHSPGACINSSTFSPGRDTDPRSTTVSVPRRLSLYSSPSVILSKVNLSSLGSAGFYRANSCTQ